MAAQPSPTSSNENIQTIAVLPLSGTTVTATVPPSTSGVAVVDGTTISFRHEGITLSNGQVFSLGFDGLVASTTTASYEYVSLSASQSVRYDSTSHPSGTSIVLTNSQDMSSTLPPDTPYLPTTSTSTSGRMSSSQGLTMSSTTASSTASQTTSTSSTGSDSGSMTTSTSTESNTSGAQVGAGNSNAAPLTTNGGGSGAPMPAPNVGLGGLFVAGLGLLVTFGAMVGL